MSAHRSRSKDPTGRKSTTEAIQISIGEQLINLLLDLLRTIQEIPYTLFLNFRNQDGTRGFCLLDPDTEKKIIDSIVEWAGDDKYKFMYVFTTLVRELFAQNKNAKKFGAQPGNPQEPINEALKGVKHSIYNILQVIGTKYLEPIALPPLTNEERQLLNGPESPKNKYLFDKTLVPRLKQAAKMIHSSNNPPPEWDSWIYTNIALEIYKDLKRATEEDKQLEITGPGDRQIGYAPADDHISSVLEGVIMGIYTRAMAAQTLAVHFFNTDPNSTADLLVPKVADAMVTTFFLYSLLSRVKMLHEYDPEDTTRVVVFIKKRLMAAAFTFFGISTGYMDTNFEAAAHLYEFVLFILVGSVTAFVIPKLYTRYPDQMKQAAFGMGATALAWLCYTIFNITPGAVDLVPVGTNTAMGSLAITTIASVVKPTEAMAFSQFLEVVNRLSPPNPELKQHVQIRKRLNASKSLSSHLLCEFTITDICDTCDAGKTISKIQSATTCSFKSILVQEKYQEQELKNTLQLSLNQCLRWNNLTSVLRGMFEEQACVYLVYFNEKEKDRPVLVKTTPSVLAPLLASQKVHLYRIQLRPWDHYAIDVFPGPTRWQKFHKRVVMLIGAMAFTYDIVPFSYFGCSETETFCITHPYPVDIAPIDVEEFNKATPPEQIIIGLRAAATYVSNSAFNALEKGIEAPKHGATFWNPEFTNKCINSRRVTSLDPRLYQGITGFIKWGQNYAVALGELPVATLEITAYTIGRTMSYVAPKAAFISWLNKLDRRLTGGAIGFGSWQILWAIGRTLSSNLNGLVNTFELPRLFLNHFRYHVITLFRSVEYRDDPLVERTNYVLGMSLPAWYGVLLVVYLKAYHMAITQSIKNEIPENVAYHAAFEADFTTTYIKFYNETIGMEEPSARVFTMISDLFAKSLPVYLLVDSVIAYRLANWANRVEWPLALLGAHTYS
jgi:hypothetical protein